ncbi:hypothetical protein TNIN_316361 [Trichonephila inaurata madagascariensis]|uniref:Uncharacterized protein n=1 Tax=Trichonephila inaurata madagascariensis TaxID=2747483 RepID=A0A8X6IYN8_9ARAC|nr:hypothetical protein TNIN_316361 [Trichonephila inaurata madagascariensis]
MIYSTLEVDTLTHFINTYSSGVLQQRSAERMGGHRAPRGHGVARRPQPEAGHALPVSGEGGELPRALPAQSQQQSHQDPR